MNIQVEVYRGGRCYIKDRSGKAVCDFPNLWKTVVWIRKNHHKVIKVVNLEKRKKVNSSIILPEKVLKNSKIENFKIESMRMTLESQKLCHKLRLPKELISQVNPLIPDAFQGDEEKAAELLKILEEARPDIWS